MNAQIRGSSIRLSSPAPPSSGTIPSSIDQLSPAVLARPVLVIEDEAVIAWTLESLLEEMGFTAIAIAASGEDALRQAKQLAPGLIVSDINLGPDAMDGVSATAAIVAGSSTPVVFVSGYAGADTRRRIEQDLASAVILRKPVSEAELRRAIMTAAR